jgi:hypothetical protein
LPRRPRRLATIRSSAAAAITTSESPHRSFYNITTIITAEKYQASGNAAFIERFITIATASLNSIVDDLLLGFRMTLLYTALGHWRASALVE